MTQGRAHCSRCNRPETACICRWITPVSNRVEVLILQHPLEVDNAKNTAGLLHLCLRQSALHVGEGFDADWLAAKLAEGDKINLLLYPPTPDAGSLGLLSPAPLPDLTPYQPEQLRLVLLDATWRKSRRQLYLNPVLQTLPRLALRDCPASGYRIRKAEAPHQLSSLEAAARALSQLEHKDQDYAALEATFAGFVAQQLAWRHPG